MSTLAIEGKIKLNIPFRSDFTGIQGFYGRLYRKAATHRPNETRKCSGKKREEVPRGAASVHELFCHYI